MWNRTDLGATTPFLLTHLTGGKEGGGREGGREGREGGRERGRERGGEGGREGEREGEGRDGSNNNDMIPQYSTHTIVWL